MEHPPEVLIKSDSILPTHTTFLPNHSTHSCFIFIMRCYSPMSHNCWTLTLIIEEKFWRKLLLLCRFLSQFLPYLYFPLLS